MADRRTAQLKAEDLFKNKNYSEALTVYKDLHAESGESKYLYNAAICQFHLSRVGDAAAILEGMTAKRELFPDSAMFLGFCYRALNQTGRAKKHFSDLILKTAGTVQARCRLMVALLTDESGETEEAEKEYERLLADSDIIGSVRAEVGRRLATLYENKKEHLKALDLYRESLNHDPESEGALAAKFRMAVCLIEISTPAEAVELLTEVEEASKGTFLGESASKLKRVVEGGVRKTERHIQSYE